MRCVVVLACCGALAACSPAAEQDNTTGGYDSSTSADGADGASDAQADASMRSETHDRSAAVLPAVQAYSDALLGGRPARAYALLSERCHTKVSLEDFTRRVASANGKVRKIRFADIRQDGSTAAVTYDYTARATNPKREPWVSEHGQWRNDDC